MIIVRLQGGLGNQMFQYATALAVSRRCGVGIKLDLDLLQSDPKRRYELHRFGIAHPQVGPWDRWRINQASRPDRRWLARLLGLRMARDREEGFDPAVLSAGPNVVLAGYFQSEHYFAELRPEVVKRFTFVAEPDPVNAALLAEIAGGLSVAVHVRRGDYISDPAAAAVFRTCGVDYYRRAFDGMKRLAPGARYFVFSDDPAWATANLRPPGDCTVVRHNTGKQDHEDLRLMRACRHFIIGNSSFSWWGAWLGESPDKRVIAPRPWFAAPHRAERDLVPEDWIRPE